MPTVGPPQPSVYKPQEVPEDPAMFPVYVVHVKTPSSFTVQLVGERTSKTLEQLTEDITLFYNGLDSDVYSIKTPYVGQVQLDSLSVSFTVIVTLLADTTLH